MQDVHFSSSFSTIELIFLKLDKTSIKHRLSLPRHLKLFAARFTNSSWQGSPPPMRGKVGANLDGVCKKRITPAHAGKRLKKLQNIEISDRNPITISLTSQRSYTSAYNPQAPDATYHVQIQVHYRWLLSYSCYNPPFSVPVASCQSSGSE